MIEDRGVASYRSVVICQRLRWPVASAARVLTGGSMFQQDDRQKRDKNAWLCICFICNIVSTCGFACSDYGGFVMYRVNANLW